MLKKTNWSLHESWILFILQRSASNRWAEISSIILGRPDNSIKNYWNSVLKHKTSEMGKNLDNYIAKCIELDKPTDSVVYKRDLTKVLMRFLVHNSQKQYLGHLRQKMIDLKYEQGTDSGLDQKVRAFKIKLLDRALTLLPTTQIKSES